MNAAVMIEADTPEIKSLRRKKLESERKLPVFREAVERAESRLELAKAKRRDNRDADQANDLLIAERLAETQLESCSEPLRVCLANISTIEQEISAATAAWRASEKERILTEWRELNDSLDKQQIGIQKKRIEKTNESMTRLHELDPGYSPVLAHGAPQFYLNSDCLTGKRLPSIEIGQARAEFKWLELPICIRS